MSFPVPKKVATESNLQHLPAVFVHTMLSAVVVNAIGMVGTHIVSHAAIPNRARPLFIAPINCVTGWVWRDVVLSWEVEMEQDQQFDEYETFAIFVLVGLAMVLFNVSCTRLSHRHSLDSHFHFFTESHHESRTTHLCLAFAKAAEGATLIPIAALIRKTIDWGFVIMVGPFAGDLGLTTLKAIVTLLLIGVLESACLACDPPPEPSTLASQARPHDEVRYAAIATATATATAVAVAVELILSLPRPT